ncbi:MAG: hypothetical protein ACOWW1_05510 [archaeon]
MSRRVRAENMAKTIFIFGRGSLSFSEIQVLDYDKQLNDTVKSLVTKMKRQALLNDVDLADIEQRKTVTMYGGNAKNIGLEHWENNNTPTQAWLWRNSLTGRVLLEIREYNNSPEKGKLIHAGSHDTPVLEIIEYTEKKELKEKCEKILDRYNCTEKKKADLFLEL